MTMNRSERLRGWLRETLDYEPVDLALFETALTHRSAEAPNNERLEFLGDAVLGMITAQYLFERFAEADEGALSRLRARLVSGDSLARLAAGIGLGEQLVLGQGELKTGGFRRESILADALEALCGALYLDGGLAAAHAAVLHLLAPALQSLTLPAELKDPKTRLQELLQARGLPLPRYSVDSVAGELHAQVFRVTCEVEPLAARATAAGSSRRRAEQGAAERVLEQIQAGL
ncbi:MAG TPA: ribonuclease III [Steroidobacteraceae bacterium]|jgi:ribonuclease-3